MESVLGGQPLEVCEPELDERPDAVRQAGLAGELERLFVGRADLLRRDSLLQPVVAGDQELLDLLPRIHNAESIEGLVFFDEVCSNAQALSVRVLIVDDHRPFAEALRAILSAERRIDVVGLAATGEEAVQRSGELEPDVVLMDISMPGVGGVEATRRILAERRDVRVLMVTGSDARQDVDASRTAGAAGYVTKDRIAAELIDAILDVAGGSRVP
jgi:CheY-like chemotaxis protein